MDLRTILLLSFITNTVAFAVALVLVLGAGRRQKPSRSFALMLGIPLALLSLYTAVATLIKLLHDQ